MNEEKPGPQAPRPGELLRDRLVLYVRALRLPPREGLELAAKTLETLRDSGMKDTSSPEARDMETAMETLRALCAERGLLPDADACPSTPPYNRGSMPPAKISMTRGGFSLRNLSLRGLIGRFRRPREGRTR